MSDDINKKIMQIAEMLGQDRMPDNMKELLSLLGSSLGKEESPQKTGAISPVKEEKSGRSEIEDSVDMFRKMKKVMDRLNTNNDPRVNLLTAVKPFLNNTRQKRLNSCIKLLQMSRLTNLVDDNNSDNF